MTVKMNKQDVPPMQKRQDGEITVDYVDHLGSDSTVVNAARVSFNKHSSSDAFSDKDAKLINYLARHNHWSPFSHCFVQLRVKAPIFVARQLAKHQVGLTWNEVSRRYIHEYPDFYKPAIWRGKAANNKQGSSGEIEQQDFANEVMNKVHEAALQDYHDLINWGVAPEMARMILPQTTMTEWYWSGSLYGFARVCKQRLDPHSQLETAEVAGWIDTICSDLFPTSWDALSRNQQQPTEGENDNEAN